MVDRPWEDTTSWSHSLRTHIQQLGGTPQKCNRVESTPRRADRSGGRRDTSTRTLLKDPATVRHQPRNGMAPTHRWKRQPTTPRRTVSRSQPERMGPTLVQPALGAAIARDRTGWPGSKQRRPRSEANTVAPAEGSSHMCTAPKHSGTPSGTSRPTRGQQGLPDHSDGTRRTPHNTKKRGRTCCRHALDESSQLRPAGDHRGDASSFIPNDQACSTGKEEQQIRHSLSVRDTSFITLTYTDHFT